MEDFKKNKYRGWLITANEGSWTSRFNYEKFDKFMEMMFKDMVNYYCYNEEVNKNSMEKSLYIYIEFKLPKRLDYLQHIFPGCFIEPRKKGVHETRNYISKENLVGDVNNLIKPFKEVGDIDTVVDHLEYEEMYFNHDNDTNMTILTEFEKMLKFYEEIGVYAVRIKMKSNLEFMIIFKDTYLLNNQEKFLFKRKEKTLEFECNTYHDYEEKLIEYMNTYGIFDIEKQCFFELKDFLRVPKVRYRVFDDFLFLKRITNVDFEHCQYVSQFSLSNKNITINTREIESIKPVYSKRVVTNNKLKQFLSDREVEIIH